MAQDEFDQPNPSVGPNTYGDRRSRSNERPLDEEGLPFLTNADVAPIFGIGEHNTKTVSYSDLPQWKESKGGDDRNARTWYSAKDIVSHLAKLSGQHLDPSQRTESHQKWEARHAHWSNQLGAARDNIAARKAQGENPGHLLSQPHPANKNIHLRMEYFPQGRVSPVDVSGAGRQTFNEGSRFSDLNAARRAGRVVRPVINTDADLTLFDPSRPSRNQRRGQS